MLKETPFLDMVVKESNRIFPPVPLIQRQLQDDFVSGTLTTFFCKLRRKFNSRPVFFAQKHYGSFITTSNSPEQTCKTLRSLNILKF